jgi:hypothetical protein
MTENDAMASLSVILGRGPNGTQELQSFSHFNENELYNKKQVSKKIETGAPLASVGILKRLKGCSVATFSPNKTMLNRKVNSEFCVLKVTNSVFI